MKKILTAYKYLTNINSLNFENKSVLIVGGGWMAYQYALALSRMNIKDVTIISKTKDNVKKISNEFGFRSLYGGYEKNLPLMKKMDLVIIATPVHLLLPIIELALRCGQANILVEKPASLYSEDLLVAAEKIKNQRVRVAYNRLLYANFFLLKYLTEEEGGISSCHFTFTEWLHTINFKNTLPDAYRRFGISNSLHVISMAAELIGFPKEISAYQSGKLDWHPSGSIFVGSGITEKGISFSYHADWESSGRWGIEVMTKENAYRLIPLEDLYVCKKNTTDWQKISFKTAFPDVKQGIAEEIALMLDKNMEQQISLVSLEKAAEFNKLAEKIFGYNHAN